MLLLLLLLLLPLLPLLLLLLLNLLFLPPRRAAGVELTAAEKKKIEVSKKVLELARDPNRHAPKTDAYQLPDAYEDEQGRIDTRRREDVLTAR